MLVGHSSSPCVCRPRATLDPGLARHPTILSPPGPTPVPRAPQRWRRFCRLRWRVLGADSPESGEALAFWDRSALSYLTPIDPVPPDWPWGSVGSTSLFGSAIAFTLSDGWPPDAGPTEPRYTYTEIFRLDGQGLARITWDHASRRGRFLRRAMARPPGRMALLPARPLRPPRSPSASTASAKPNRRLRTARSWLRDSVQGHRRFIS